MSTLISRIIDRAQKSLSQEELISLVDCLVIKSRTAIVDETLNVNSSYVYASRNSDGSIEYKKIS